MRAQFDVQKRRRLREARKEVRVELRGTASFKAAPFPPDLGCEHTPLPMVWNIQELFSYFASLMRFRIRHTLDCDNPNMAAICF